MTFTRPDLLYGGLAVGLLILIALWAQGRRRSRLADFLGGGRAISRLSSLNLYRWRVERVILLGGASAMLALAAAGPIWREPPVAPAPPPIERNVVIAMDVSASMQAADVSPNRLGAGVDVARQLLGSLEGERVGLLLFAGQTYVLAPPTHDHRPIQYYLDGLVPTIASAHDPGSRISAGLDAARALLGPAAENTENSVVVISDGDIGEGNAAVSRSLDRLLEENVEVHAVGVGTERATSMNLPAAPYQLAGPVNGPDGSRGFSRLRPPVLQQLASRGNGAYALAADPGQVEALIRALEPPPAEEVDEPVPPVWAAYDLTFWLVAAALLGLIIDSLIDVRLPRFVRGFVRRPT